MISCTEFIPAYSELFSFLDENYGRAEVEKFWTYLFAPTGKGIPLINFAKRDGLRGCWDYWSGTLKEEAADCTRYFNEKAGWIASEMHYCPSKGRLLELEKEIGLKPYYDYCGHCDYYRAALDMVGLKWVRNHLHVDKASCSSILYNPKVFKGIMVPDEHTEVMTITSKDSEYFHPDFHSSLNMGIDYVAREHGEEAMRRFLHRYTVNVYGKTIAAVRENGLPALEAMIRETYAKEQTPEVLTTVLKEDTLLVQVAECPAVKHLRATGREVSPWYRYTTETVMEVLADRCGLRFVMVSYDEDTGTAEYRFEK